MNDNILNFEDMFLKNSNQELCLGNKIAKARGYTEHEEVNSHVDRTIQPAEGIPKSKFLSPHFPTNICELHT